MESKHQIEKPQRFNAKTSNRRTLSKPKNRKNMHVKLHKKTRRKWVETTKPQTFPEGFWKFMVIPKESRGLWITFSGFFGILVDSWEGARGVLER